MKDCVLLDFDGTVTTRDTTRFLIIELIKLRPLRLFGAMWFIFKILASKDGETVQKYKNKTISYLIAGLSDSQMAPPLTNFKNIVHSLYRPLLLKKIYASNERGFLNLIVTASPTFAIEACVSDLPVKVLGTDFRKIAGVYSGTNTNTNCYGANKPKLIEKWRKKNNLKLNYIEAWSDSFSDYPMLEMAFKRYWIGDFQLKNKILARDPESIFISKQAE